jgi:hypothetical protein
MKKILPLLTLLLSGHIPAYAAHWVQLDKVGGESYLLRQADRDSIQRTGPWAEFTQQWVSYKDGVPVKAPPVNEVMAVNCLTGASWAKAYQVTDPVTEKRVLFSRSFAEIEEGTPPATRIDITNPPKGLDANLIDFACGCQNRQASKPGDENTLLKIYDTFVKEQTREVSYRLRFMEFATRQEANAALKMIEAGASFAAVAAKLKPQPEFPGGDLGVHPASDWPPSEVQLFRKMKPGDYTKQPIKAVYGYDLYFMEHRYEKPAAPFSAWKAAIQTYAERTQSCGRTLF